MKHTARKGAAGSTFIMVLLVLIILTGVGLSLVFVTDMEVQLGHTEKMVTNTFYAAESGLHAALAGIPSQNWQGEKFALVEDPMPSGQKVATRIITSRVHAVGPPQIPPMTVANEGGNNFHTFATAVNAVAQRVIWTSNEPVPIYEKGDNREDDVTIQSHCSVTVRYLVSPVRTPSSPAEPYNEDTALEF